MGALLINIFKNTFKSLFKLTSSLIMFPIKRLLAMFKHTSDGFSVRNFILVFVNLFALTTYIAILFSSYMFIDTIMMVKLSGVIGVLASEKIIKYDGPSEFPTTGVTGSGTFGGVEFTFDFDKLPENVSLPSNYYQSGTVRQRAEMLIIIQEICARPEIDLSPEELLGIFYVEQTGGFKANTSLINSTFPEEYNGSGYGGPFQHGRDTFNNPVAMKEIQGNAFICSLEDSTLDDSQRVKTLTEVGSLKTPDGNKRPNMFYFPDAAYTTAFRISEYKKGLYNGNVDQSTKPVFDWLNANDFGDATEDFIRYNMAVERYSGFNGYLPHSNERDNCCRSWVPALYLDIMGSKGEIHQWSDLATSRASLIKALSGDRYDGTAYKAGDGIVGSTPMSGVFPEKPKQTYSTYKDYWRNGGGKHLPSHYYSFTAINGGKWIYEGLLALGDAVGTQTGSGNTSGGNYDSTDLNGYISPLNFERYVVTSKYHEDRVTYSHRGVDIDTGTGDPIYAPRDGVITLARWDSACQGGKYPKRGGGKMVWIKFDNGVEARMMHLDSWAVKAGQQVKQGDIIGYTGNTGGSTGDHLHIELWENGKEFDPTFLFSGKPITYLK